jgi:hypothetical protein
MLEVITGQGTHDQGGQMTPFLIALARASGQAAGSRVTL